MKPLSILLAAALILSGCYTTQTSSGQAYVNARPGAGQIDKDIAKIAAVEPNLRFPAKIGLARIINGRLTLASEKELQAYQRLAERKRALGEFVAVSPFSAEIAAARLPADQRKGGSVLQNIRRAAAVQHVDYVLVYEIGASSSVFNTPFALADATIIGGALLPTRGIKVLGTGKAVLLDVRNSYPYATMQTQADLSGLARSFGASRVESNRLRDKAIHEVSLKLIPEFEKALEDLAARS